MKKINDKRIGNAPAQMIVKLWDDLYQTKMNVDLSQKTNAEIYKLLVYRHEKGKFITFLTHQGPFGSWGPSDFINDLAGM